MEVREYVSSFSVFLAIIPHKISTVSPKAAKQPCIKLKRLRTTPGFEFCTKMEIQNSVRNRKQGRFVT